jgi:hypothetical protein
MNAPVKVPTPEDLDREARIAAFLDVVTKATSPSRKRLALAQMHIELNARTPEMVAWLDAHQGTSAADAPQRPVPASVFRRTA